MRRINCYKCEYLQITFQPNTPYACNAYGFKSKLMPSLAVYQSSGAPCSLFKAKQKDDTSPKAPPKPPSNSGGWYA